MCYNTRGIQHYQAIIKSKSIQNTGFILKQLLTSHDIVQSIHV